MSNIDNRQCEVLLSLQRALLGAISPAIRAVTVRFDESSIYFEVFVHGEISDEVREAMSEVETEVMADFSSVERVSHALVRLDPPELIPKDRHWVYFRREDD